MERKREIEYNDLLPKKDNPLNEIVTYKVGGTLYEVSTVCGGSELLYDTKLAARFMKCQRFAAALNCSMTK